MARLHKTTDKFIVEAREKIGSHYDFSKTIYQGIGVPTTISCPVHGDFTTTPKSVLLQGTACPTCRKQQRVKDRTSSRDDFISAANVAHGLVYDYSNVIYKTSMTKVEIVCPTHGPFSQTPNNHVSKKQGCPKCWQERRPGGIGGYTQGYFDKYPERKSIPATLYVIEMSCRTDHFIKVGITIRSVKVRFQRTHTSNYQIKHTSIYEVSLPLYEAYQLEQHILKTMEPHKYFPNYIFDGKTECLKATEHAIAQVLSIIEQKVKQ